MIRTYVHYGHQVYIVGHATSDQVRAEVEDILAAGRPGWLRVNFGDGQEQPAEILITPGVPIGVYTAQAAEDAVAD